MKREKVLKGTTTKIKTGCGSTFITLNLKKDLPFELFIRMGKSGGCASANCEALGRTISLALQAGVEIKSLVKNLGGICCQNSIEVDGDKVTSCADAIARVLKMYIEENKIVATAAPEKN